MPFHRVNKKGNGKGENLKKIKTKVYPSRIIIIKKKKCITILKGFQYNTQRIGERFGGKERGDIYIVLENRRLCMRSYSLAA